jgi:5-methylcytosine-specific restriction enzyme A
MPRAPKAPGHHVKIPWDGSTRRQRLPPDWPAIQRAVLERDGHQCQLRYDGCTTLASHADHIEAGDDHRMASLQAACSHCHAIKSSAEGNAARWGDRS